ncbi:MAG: hypothetical protein ACI9NC_005559 [Verrucomicrobiales bacterium]
MMKNIFLSVVLFAAIQSIAYTADKFEIDLLRPYKTGQVYELSAQAGRNNQSKLMVDGKPVDAAPGANSNTVVKLDATETILTVDAEGRIEKCLLKIIRLTSNEVGGDEKELSESGTEVVVSIGSDEIDFSRKDGETISKSLNSSLSQFYDPRKDDASDDLLFGTDELIGVGESWKIDSEAAAKGLSQNGMAIKPDQIRGKMKLVGLVEKDGVKCLEIHGAIEMATLAPPMPDGIKISSSGGRLTLVGFFPVDGALQVSEKTSKMYFHIKASGATGDGLLELESKGRMGKVISKKLVE